MSDDTLETQARFEAELELARNTTIPSPPPASPAEVAALGRAMLGLDEVSRYLGGTLRGELADAANELGTALREEQSEFEERVLSALERIERKLECLDEIQANVSLICSAYQDHASRLTRLEQVAHAPLHAVAGGKSA